jgi:tetratricopeptide (TPR) repeat protein
MLVSVLAVSLACRFIKQRWLGVAVVCGVAVVFSFWTYGRNSVWSNEVVLWQDCVKKSPQKARPHNNLGHALEGEGEFDEAISHYLEAIRIMPDYAEARGNLGAVLKKQGKIDEAIVHLRMAVQLAPHYHMAHYNLGVCLVDKGKIDQGMRHYYEALRLAR